MPGGDGTGSRWGGGGGGRGRGGRGMGGGFAQGPDGECVCPNCGYREKHRLGTPCYSLKCPKCGTPMTRA